MSGSRSAIGIAGICAVAFAGAYAAGTATRTHDVAKAPAAVGTTHARPSIADLAPAAALPGLRVDRVVPKRRATGQTTKPLATTAVAARPVRVVAAVPRPVTSTPVARPAPARSTPAPTVHHQSTDTSSVAFFDDGG